jgi:hypothetical protein
MLHEYQCQRPTRRLRLVSGDVNSESTVMAALLMSTLKRLEERLLLPTIDIDDNENRIVYGASTWNVAAVGFIGVLCLMVDFFRFPEIFYPEVALFSDQIGFFWTARGAGLGTVLIPDFNYISLLPRLIAAVADFLAVQPSQAGTFYQVLGSYLRGCIVGIFTLPVFRLIISSDGLRWLFVAIILTIGDHQIRFLHNIGYVQILVIPLIAAVCILARGRLVNIMLLLVCALVLTKILAAIVLPLLVAVAIRQRGAGRLLAVIGLFMLISNIILSFVITYSSPNLGSWLQDQTVTSIDRLKLGVALPGRIMSLLGGMTSLDFSFSVILGSLFISLVFATYLRHRLALVVIGIVSMIYAYSFVSTWIITRFLNWKSIDGQVFLVYHVYPLYGWVLLVLSLGVQAIAKQAAALTSGRVGTARPVESLAVAAAAFLLIAPGWQALITAPNLMFRSFATAGMWGQAWPAIEDPDGRSFCIPAPFMFHNPLSVGGCRYLGSHQLSTRWIWSEPNGPSEPIIVPVSRVTPTSSRISGVVVHLRTVSAYTQVVKLDIEFRADTVSRQAPIYAQVSGVGSFVFIPIDGELTGVEDLIIIPERPVRIQRDEQNGTPNFTVFGRHPPY